MSRPDGQKTVKKRALVGNLAFGPILNGLADEVTAREWLGEANRLDAPVEVKKRLADKIEELSND